MNVFLDIETLPTQRPDICAEIAAKYVGSADAISKADTEHRKTALDGAFGEVLCIAVAVDDGAVHTWHRTLQQSEAELLAAFAASFNELVRGKKVTLVGHNIAFDRRVLRQRGLVHGVRMPTAITAQVKPWESSLVQDTMMMWCGDAHGRISLDTLCRALGLPSKSGGIDGSRVWDEVLAGRIDDVVSYCAADVERTRNCFTRLSLHEVTQ